MALTPGTRLGVYEIIAAIGEGGMGQVFRARDTRLDRAVAIKILPEAFAHDADRLARFTREAKTLASLNHPHIAGIYGLEESDGITALVMELVEGEDLSRKITHGAIPLDESLPIARQIAEALEAAHEQGIVHRDLKPANIKVRADGTVKVLDFGLAKAIERTTPSGVGANLEHSPTLTSPALMTGAGVILGTAAYMAPEQAKGRPVDKRADTWAFGVVLFEMLTGTRAFAGEDVTDTIVSVMSREPDWSVLPAGLPPAVSVVLRCCLQKDRRQRLGDMQDVRLGLEGAFESPASMATAPAPQASIWRAHAGWFVAALAVTAAAVFAARTARPTAMQATQESPVRFIVSPPDGARQPYINYYASGFSLSPDGRSLAYGAIGKDGVPRIYLRRLDAPESKVVPGTERAAVPFWSPDGQSLGFARDGSLYRSGLDGSAMRRLCDVPSAILRGATWSPRRVIVFGTGASSGLLQVPEDGGAATPLTTLDDGEKEASHTSPWFLPDGRHLIYLALGQGSGVGTIWATAIDDPARTRLVKSAGGAAYADGRLLFRQNDTVVAQPFDAARLALSGAPQTVRDSVPSRNTGGHRFFTVSERGVLAVEHIPTTQSTLSWMDRSGRDLGTLVPPAGIADFALAPDERRAVATISADGGRDLWLFDGVRPEGVRLTFNPTTRPMWSADGRRVLFLGGRPGPYGLSELALGASAPTAFEWSDRYAHFEDMTRDGRTLILKGIGSPPSIWLQRTETDEHRVLVQSPYAVTRPRVSPDGRWLAYTLDLPAGPEVFVQPFDREGPRTQVSLKGGIGPVWRDDGRELFYEGSESVMAVPVAERGGTLDVGTPQALFSIRTRGNVGNQPHNFEVAAHGQKFLVNAIVGESDNAPLEVTLHWDAGLAK